MVCCLAAVHDHPEPSSTAPALLEALVCCRPSEAQHSISDAAPCPLVVGGPSNGKHRVNEKPSEPRPAWEAIGILRDAGALHFKCTGVRLAETLRTCLDRFFYRPPAACNGCEPWKRLPARRSAGLMVCLGLQSHARVGTPVRG
jgi:hypothetical protein